MEAKPERRRSSGTWKATRTSFTKEDAEVAKALGAGRRAWDPALVRHVDKPLTEQLAADEVQVLCQHLPKLELHAHLSGSVLESTLQELCVTAGQDPGQARFKLESLSGNETYEKVWQETVEAFETIRKLTANDISVLRRIITEAVQFHAADGCVYYEIRTGLKKLPDKRTFLAELIATLGTAQAKYGLITRLLLSVDRGASVEDCKETIDIAIDAFEGQSTAIGGGILVGVEMGGNPLRGDFARDFRYHFDRARSAGLKVSLHFAENRENEAEHSAILDFAPDRVGHAVYMSDAICRRLLAQRIPVEVCMTCHQAFYKVSMGNNILGTLLQRQHPAILCCDNACLLQTLPSMEHAHAIRTFGLTARDLHRMVMDATDAIFADPKTKAKVRALCETRLDQMFPKLKSQGWLGRARALPHEPWLPQMVAMAVIVAAGAAFVLRPRG